MFEQLETLRAALAPYPWAYTVAVIAGLRLDTSAARDRSGLKGPQWRPDNRRDHKSFTVVHPAGF